MTENILEAMRPLQDFNFMCRWFTAVQALICGLSPAEVPSQQKVQTPTCTSEHKERDNSSDLCLVFLRCHRYMTEDSYRALRAVLYVVHDQLDLCLEVNVTVLEKGDATQERGVTGALRGNQGYSRYAMLYIKQFLFNLSLLTS